MGTVIEMRPREIIDMHHVEDLLTRLEWRLDEPCVDPGCLHVGVCRGDGDDVIRHVAA